MLKAGTVCRVVEDSLDFFKPGDIVVTLEDSVVPYCCLEKHYNPRQDLKYYDSNLVNALMPKELEELYDWAKK